MTSPQDDSGVVGDAHEHNIATLSVVNVQIAGMEFMAKLFRGFSLANQSNIDQIPRILGYFALGPALDIAFSPVSVSRM